MVNKSPLRTQSYEFALQIVLLCKELMSREKEYVLSKQLLRCGTSIGANIEEAQQPESRKDFISKLSIALKEAYECRFWIRILTDSSYISEGKANFLLDRLESVIRLLSKSIQTAKRN